MRPAARRTGWTVVRPTDEASRLDEATRGPVARTDALHVVARVGADRFAFRVADVEEVIDAPALLPVPGATSTLVGQFAHRGRTVTAYNAGWVLGRAASASPASGEAAIGNTAIVLRVADDRAALIVDDVEDLTPLEAEAVRAVPAGSDPAGVLRGVCLPRAGGTEAQSLIGVVNVTAVLARARVGPREGAA